MRVVWKRYLRRFIESVERQPGALAVRKAMQASPELRAIDQADNEQLAKALAELLSEHIAGLSLARAQFAARVLPQCE